MLTRIRLLILLCGTLFLTSCSYVSGSAYRHDGVTAVSANVESETSPAVNREKTEISQKNDALQNALSEAWDEAEGLLSSVESLNSELSNWKELAQIAEADLAAVVREFQEYRNRVEVYLGIDSDVAGVSQNPQAELYQPVLYSQLIENAADYELKQVSISGYIESVTTEGEFTYLLLSFDRNPEERIQLEIPSSLTDADNLEPGERLQVYGISYGLLPFYTSEGQDLEIPGIKAEIVVTDN